jgi:hypothetical protein
MTKRTIEAGGRKYLVTIKDAETRGLVQVWFSDQTEQEFTRIAVTIPLEELRPRLQAIVEQLRRENLQAQNLRSQNGAQEDKGGP